MKYIKFINNMNFWIKTLIKSKFWKNGNYFDIPINYCQYSNSKLVILPIPYEGSVNFKHGSGNGPWGILQGSNQIEHYSLHFNNEPFKIGVHSHIPLILSPFSEELAMIKIYKVVHKIKSDNKIPIILGGSHVISSATVRACLPKKNTVIMLDAHTDLWDNYNGTKWNHACTGRRISEYNKLIIIGCRNFSKEEMDYAEKKHVFLIPFINGEMDARLAKKYLDNIKGQIYLSIDVDVLDTPWMPCSGTPEPGGFSWINLLKLIDKIIDKNEIAGIDIVEFSPKKTFYHVNVTIASLLYYIIGCLTCKYN